jgi:hypothetical protein
MRSRFVRTYMRAGRRLLGYCVYTDAMNQVLELAEIDVESTAPYKAEVLLSVDVLYMKKEIANYVSYSHKM